MPIAKHVVRQNDFSAGQLSATAKRGGDKPFVRAGARQMENFRLMATGASEVRPGRSALFLQDGRVDEVRMSVTSSFKLCFGNNAWIVRDETGAVVATDGGRPWTTASAAQVVWTRIKNQIVAFFPGSRPRVATWDGVSPSGWTFADFAFLQDGQGRRY